MAYSGPERREWVVVATIALFSVILLVLQVRWTGALSRAELQVLQTSLRTRTAEVAGTFDGELRRLCTSLAPTVAELDEFGRDAAHKRRWKDSSVRDTHQPFQRIAVVTTDADELSVFTLDQRDGTLVRAEWPASWEGLREQMVRRWKQQGPPPTTPRESSQIEVPIMSGAAEREWMVFDLDERYVTATWLPDLMTASFPSEMTDDTLRYQVRGVGGAIIFSWPASLDVASRQPDAVAGLFPQALVRPLQPDRDMLPRWTLNVWHAAGPLETEVARARSRNLAVASLLVVLIAGTAWSRTRLATRARRLAARELAFVAGVSHELRTPLATIRAAGHNLRSNLIHDMDKQRAYGDLIVQRADQVITMVEQLLSLASLRRSAHPAAPVTIGLADLLDDALRATSDAVARSGCQVDVNVPTELPPVLGDRTALRRVFDNLIVNAATHGAAGGWIGVTARSVSRKGLRLVEVSVADRGPGISAAEQARVWEPFVRGAVGESGTHRGFGLGLNLVREIVAQHGGEVLLRSNGQSGTTFTVCLPALQGSQ